MHKNKIAAEFIIVKYIYELYISHSFFGGLKYERK
jgi:hypothetical protein